MGVFPLPRNQFKDVVSWRDFIIRHEKAHSAFPIKDGEAPGAYENRINQIALGKAENGDRIFTWNKFDRNILLDALNAKDKGADPLPILNKLKPPNCSI